MTYFEDGKLLYSYGDVRVYDYGGLFLEIGRGHNLWALEDERFDYDNQFLAHNPTGHCLEIGLGIGVASQLIMNYNIDSLTTVDMNLDVINTYKFTKPLLESRKWNNRIGCIHNIVFLEGSIYLKLTSKKFDYIFLDFYKAIDEDSLPEIEYMVNTAKDRLTDKGTIVGWIDPYTNSADCKKFKKIFSEFD
jgi:spermidine synthase